MGSGSHRVQHRKHQEPGCCRRSTALTLVCSRAWRKRNYSIVSWKDAECSVMSSFLVPKTPFCGEPGAREYALYFDIVCRGHPQSNPTNKICADIEFLLSDISGNRNYLSLVLLWLPRENSELPQKESLPFQKMLWHFLPEWGCVQLGLCTAAFPTSCSFALREGRTEPQNILSLGVVK